MTDPKDKRDTEPMPSPTWKPSPPEMDLEPIPLPDRTDEYPLGDDLPGEGMVSAVPSRDEANMEPDEALPDDAEEEILNDDPAREKIRFDEEIPKSSR